MITTFITVLERYSASFAWTRIVVLISVSATMLCARTAYAMPQMGGVPAIRVESGEVLVPTAVFSRQDYAPVSDLTVADFQLFEDGKEQRVQQVTRVRTGGWFVDNFGVQQKQGNSTPGQRWAMLLRKPLPGNLQETPGYLYLLAYVPPDSAEGSCHAINVKVKRVDVVVSARDEYCNTPHPASDPLGGTSLSKQMEDFGASDNAGRIPLSIQAGFFYSNAESARVNVTVEFPSGDIRYQPNPSGLRYEIAYSAVVSRTDGRVSARFSDLIEQKLPVPHDEDTPQFYLAEKQLIANHHETQTAISPGAYVLRVVLGDGGKFGKAGMTLTVPPLGDMQLGISSIFVCRQFHDPKDDGLSISSALTDFVPLVSKGREFTPTGDTTFRKKDIFFAYFEVYEPSLTSDPTTRVQTRLRIINTATGQDVTDTGWQSAEVWIEPGNRVIRIAPIIELKKMTRGPYQIEVQASDSAGRTTDTRTATFAVD